MYKFILVTFFVLFFSANASAQTLEVQEKHSEIGWGPTYDMYGATHFEESDFGVQAFTAMTSGWAEAYAGPTYAPTEWLELSLMAGAQSVGSTLEPRYATSLWAEHGRLSTLMWVEFDHGGTDTAWYDVWGKYQTADWLSVGIRSRRFTGTGPTMWLTATKIPVGLWLSWTPVGFEEDVDVTRGMGGISFTF